MKVQTYLNQNYLFKERETITELNLIKQNLSGHLDLRDFINLEKIEADHNQLTSIDFSNCSKLKEVSVLGNQLIDLYLSRQPDLVSLICSENQLKFLDLSNNQRLKTLFANDNRLTNLEFLGQLENPEKLKRLSLFNNQITPISLKYFWFFPNLKTLLVEGNSFEIEKGDLESLAKLRITDIEAYQIQPLGSKTNKI